MKQLIFSPEKFADLFNMKVPGAYRQITSEDVRDMTECGLIGRYGYYMQLDIETVPAILRHERLRQNRERRAGIRNDDGVVHCRRCGVALATPKSEHGRPREYWADCEPFRSRERHRRWKARLKQDRLAQ